MDHYGASNDEFPLTDRAPVFSRRLQIPSGDASHSSAFSHPTPSHLRNATEYFDNNRSSAASYTSVNTDTSLISRPSRRPIEPSSAFRQFLFDGWLWEFLGAVVSTAAFATIIGVLHKYDGKDLPQWPYRITLNAFISALATIAKGSILLVVAEAISQFKWLRIRRKQARPLNDLQAFDEASRGPWGAVKLLFATRGMTWASLGAVITIALLAFDTVIQQVITYPQRHVNVTDVASVYYAQEYGGNPYWNPWPGPEVEMIAAIQAGVLDPSQVSEVNPTCFSGNCTWAPFSSLALQGVCKNVTTETRRTCDTSINESNGPNATAMINAQCNYTTPGGIFLQKAVGVDRIISSTLSLDAQESDQLVRLVAGMPNPLAQFARTQLDNEAGEYQYETIECALDFCVKTWHVNMTGSKLFVDTIAIWPDPSNKTPSILYDLGSTYASNYTLNPPADWIRGPAKGNFTISSWSYGYLQTALANIINGNRWPSTIGLAVRINGTYQDAADSLTAVANFSAMTDAVAMSMTNYIRTGLTQMNPPTSLYFNGTSWAVQPHVHVRWVWLTYPLALVVTSVVFLCIAVISTKKDGARVWKSSVLATILHGLDAEVEYSADKLSEMEDVGRGVKVRLERIDRGEWRLVQR